MKNELQEHVYNIKPSARLIYTIGSDIIKDPFAALIELVKNSYDADATRVNIEFEQIASQNPHTKQLKISVLDDGHGMSTDTVKNCWLVPATSNKLVKHKSPKGRIFQGRKGIGRYASSILGDDLLLRTIDENGQKTTLKLKWSDFNNSKYLEEVPISVISEITKETNGTLIEIIYSYIDDCLWNKKAFNELIKELQKLVSPIQENFVEYSKEKFSFNIQVSFKNLEIECYKNRTIPITPIPLFDLYDYRLSGYIDKFGNANLIYENTLDNSKVKEKLVNKIILQPSYDDNEYISYCGNLQIDIRVFDREPKAIDNLIKKGVKDSINGNYLGKLETRRLLDQMCGINIYRNNFRIRPYGDEGYDWLFLDKQRVQRPSYKLGTNQVLGYVQIDSEESSKLEEKSSREGLKENNSYRGLVEILSQLINFIEQRRFAFRKSTGRSRNIQSIQETLQNIFDFKNLSTEITDVVHSTISDKEKTELITDILIKTEKEKQKDFKKIQEIIAMYQGQVTLGKIIMVLMHEGRKPIQWLKEHPKALKEYISLLDISNDVDKDILNEIISITDKNAYYAKMLAKLFDKIEPLSVRNKKRIKKFNLYTVIEKSIDIFKIEAKNNNIKFTVKSPNNIEIVGYEEDFYITFTNIFENSLYWLNSCDIKSDKEISVQVTQIQNQLIIDILDNGPGISQENIQSQVIFDPEFSTKNNGTGLGLAISGEAIKRNNGILEAVYSEIGAHIRIKIPNKGDYNEHN